MWWIEEIWYGKVIAHFENRSLMKFGFYSVIYWKDNTFECVHYFKKKK